MHRWVKLRLHVYICRTCGTGKVHAQRRGAWITTYHRPTGQSVESQHVPPCELGERTAVYLATYADAIAASLT
jgi:hypothetical protein